MNWQNIESLLSNAWLYNAKLLSSYIDLSLYEKLRQEIPDPTITIEHVFLLEEIKAFNLEPYFTELEIVPFIGTLSDTVICIGYGNSNKDRIFYFDFDFGCIPFGSDNLNQFINNLSYKKSH